MKRAIILFLMFSSFGYASSHPDNISDKAKTYFQSVDFFALLQKECDDINKKLSKKSKPVKNFRFSQVFKEFKFCDSSKYPIEGAGDILVTTLSNPEEPSFRMLIVANPSKGEKIQEPEVTTFLLGKSVVSMQLFFDTAPMAYVAAKAKNTKMKNPDCNTKLFMPVDSEVIKIPTPLQKPIKTKNYTYVSEWKERWYYNLCGNIVSIDIVFLMDEKGGTTFQIPT